MRLKRIVACGPMCLLAGQISVCRFHANILCTVNFNALLTESYATNVTSGQIATSLPGSRADIRLATRMHCQRTWIRVRPGAFMTTAISSFANPHFNLYEFSISPINVRILSSCSWSAFGALPSACNTSCEVEPSNKRFFRSTMKSVCVSSLFMTAL